MRIKGNSKDWQTRLRLWAAIIMAVYVVVYTSYYSVGLISTEAMEAYQDVLSRLWPLFWIIPLVVIVHVSLGMWKIFKRNTLKMPLWEMTQILLGICIPFFLLPHIIYSYGIKLFFGMQDDYIDQLMRTYPHFTWQFIGMTLAIWIHAQIGVHVVLRMRRWYTKIKFLIIVVFTIMPVIGIGGYLKGSMEALEDVRAQKEIIHPPTIEELAFFNNLSRSVYIIFPLLYVGVFTGRAVRLKKKNNSKNISINYLAEGKTVLVFPDTTILEASRIGNIPHASICGGRGRCTTCRVKVDNGMENLSKVGVREEKALTRIGAQKDVRLACQAECQNGSIFVTLLLPPDIKSIRARKETELSIGSEMELVVMFIDLRGFTALSEEKFPYDVVFILNRYFHYMGELIEQNGGIIDKFLGDGILSFFGFKTTPDIACIQALNASKDIAEKLIEINEQLKHILKEPLEIGVGLHAGEVILGEMGYKEKTSLTIIGDTVNTASRLQSLNKKTGSQMIFSSAMADKIKVDFSHLEKRRAAVRGKNEPIEFYVVKDIVRQFKDLPKTQNVYSQK